VYSDRAPESWPLRTRPTCSARSQTWLRSPSTRTASVQSSSPMVRKACPTCRRTSAALVRTSWPSRATRCSPRQASVDCGVVASFNVYVVHLDGASLIVDEGGGVVPASQLCCQPFHLSLLVAATLRVSFYIDVLVVEVDALVGALATARRLYQRKD